MSADGLVQVVALTDAPPATELLERAEADLRRLPGVGAVVLTVEASPSAVVTWTHLLARSDGSLASLVRVLTAKSYEVLDQDLQRWAPPAPARRFGAVRTAAR